MEFMIQPWVPGILLGGYCLVYGLVLGFLGPRRRARYLAFSVHYGLLGLSVALLVGGALAYGLGLGSATTFGYVGSGLAGLVTMWGLGVVLKALYN